jgi:RNA polymerase sigma factor (sigma-70 family)
VATNGNNNAALPLWNALRAHDIDTLGDGQLLEQFLARRDEVAFAALVRRHGPMVLGVCRRVLGNATDAEDAFQAAFLVLVRKARALAGRAVVGDWLHGVARRTALKARAAAARRRAREQGAPRPAPPAEPRDERLPRLDEELARLPEKYRLPLVLCDLEGRTRQEAAGQLGWPEGTVAGRLARGRALLAKRLLRGAQVAAGVALVEGAAQAALPPGLVAATTQAAALLAAGERVTRAALTAQAYSLAEGVVRAMLWTKIQTGAFLVLLATALLGAGAFTFHALAGDEPVQKGDVAPGTKPAPDPQPKGKQPPADEDLLRGLWTIKRAEAQGKHIAVETSEDQVWAIADGTIHIRYNDGSVDEWTFKLDPTASPRAIDVKSKSGIHSDRPAFGIYEVKGDTLRVSIHWGQPAWRPEAFIENKENRGRRDFVLERIPQAKQDEQPIPVPWQGKDKDLLPTKLDVEVTPAAKVQRTKLGLALTVTITNRSKETVTAKLRHEWYGGEWPTTDTYASVTPEGTANKVKPFHEAYLFGHREEKTVDTITVAPGKSADFELRMDWPGTGSQQAVPLMDPGAGGKYVVRLLTVFEAAGTRQYAVSKPTNVEVPPPGQFDLAGLSAKVVIISKLPLVGTDLEAELVLINDGKKPIKLAKTSSRAMNNKAGSITVLVTPGKAIGEAVVEEEIVTLKPGETLTLPVAAKDIRPLNGKLTLSVTYDIREDFARKHDTWTGPIAAKPVEIEVVQAKDKQPSVREIDLKGLQAKLAKGDIKKPAVIKTRDDLARAFPDKEWQERIAKQVDLDKEYLLYFVWGGSGMDKLEYRVEYPENATLVVFDYKPGVTLDLVGYHRLFVLPRDCWWEIGSSGKTGRTSKHDWAEKWVRDNSDKFDLILSGAPSSKPANLVFTTKKDFKAPSDAVQVFALTEKEAAAIANKMVDCGMWGRGDTLPEGPFPARIMWIRNGVGSAAQGWPWVLGGVNEDVSSLIIVQYLLTLGGEREQALRKWLADRVK